MAVLCSESLALAKFIKAPIGPPQRYSAAPMLYLSSLEYITMVCTPTQLTENGEGSKGLGELH